MPTFFLHKVGRVVGLLTWLSVTAFAQQSIIPDSLTLIAHYPLQVDANDVVGQHGPMILVNAPFEDGGIRLTGIYEFAVDPTNASNAGTPNLDDLNLDAFAISAEFKMNDVEASYPVLIGGRFWRWIGAWVFSDSTIYMDGNDYAYMDRSLGKIDLNTRYTLTIVYSASQQKGTFYLDDTEIGSLENFVIYHDDDKDFSVTHYGLGRTFKGIFGNLKVYSYVESSTAIDRHERVSDSFQLVPNYPNPFRKQTTIRYVLPETTDTRLELYDAMGRQIRILFDERQLPGWHEVKIEANDLSNGLYFYRLMAGNFFETGQMVVLK